jgi:tetratricopeptide (TPR) repeat protein
MKTFLVIITLVLLNKIAYTQQPTINDSITYYYETGSYKKALNYAQRDVKNYKIENDTLHQYYTTALNHLGNVNFTLGYFNQAFNNYNSALLVQRKITNANPYDSLETIINLAEIIPIYLIKDL